jgi:diacylglycerol kinase family enzyme
VVNPRARQGPRSRIAEAAIASLREAAHGLANVETRGDHEDPARVADAIAKERPDVVAALGGDGTAGVALGGVLRAGNEARAALALLPMGTGNNAARSFGLRSLRSEDGGAIALAVGTIARGARHPIDVGIVNERPFLGSFAVGLDGEILARRNRIQRQLERTGAHTGYGLYLASFALSFVASRPHARAQLVLDGEAETTPLYNLVVTNAPVYAGPLRFDGANDCSDGRLDVHAVAGALPYVSEYPRAWVRYLRGLRGASVAPSPLLRRAREIRLELDRPLAALVDGEEIAAAQSYRLHALERAVRLCVPPATRP